VADSIDVDLRGLDQFSGDVKAVTSAVLAPGADWAFSVFRAGAAFGGRFTASREVVAARLKYHDALVSVTTSLAGFVNASQMLVAAVEQVRTRYADADADAAARSAGAAEINAVLVKATVDAAQQQSVSPLLASDVSSEGEARSVMGTKADWEPTGCVEWSRFTVPQLWDMVRDTDAGTVTFAQQRAWQETNALLAGHASRLRAAQEELLSVWPPSSSPAAKAFNRYTDALLATMQRVAGDAGVNADATGGLGHALIAAKERMAPIYARWMRQEAAQRNQSVLQQATDLVGLTGPDAWREPLQREAAHVMATADLHVAQARAALQAPPPFRTVLPPEGPPTESGSSGIGATGGAGAGWMDPPVISQPQQPTPGQVGTGGPDVVAIGPGTGEPGWVGGDPVLAGSAVPSVSSTPMPAPVSAVDGSVGQGSLVGGLLGALPGVVVGGLGASALGVNGGGSPGVVGRTGGPVARVSAPVGSPQQGRLVGPGGIIGGPGMPTPPVAGIGAGSRGGVSPAARLGRTGGVIGAQSGTHHVSPPVGTTGSAGRRRADNGERRVGFDPDNPWAVAEGGPGVIEPGPAPTRHDPGPGVFGIDR